VAQVARGAGRHALDGGPEGCGQPFGVLGALQHVVGDLAQRRGEALVGEVEDLPGARAVLGVVANPVGRVGPQAVRGALRQREVGVEHLCPHGGRAGVAADEHVFAQHVDVAHAGHRLRGRRGRLVGVARIVLAGLGVGQ
jgi:hypothetical protein